MLKIQDLLFIFSFFIILGLRKIDFFVYLGISFLVISIFLYSKWIFFTAERLVWYASGFFFVYTLINLYQVLKIRKG
jgi:hypothetical protein